SLGPIGTRPSLPVRLRGEIAPADQGASLPAGIRDLPLADEPAEVIDGVAGFVGGLLEAQQLVLVGPQDAPEGICAVLEGTRLGLGSEAPLLLGERAPFVGQLGNSHSGIDPSARALVVTRSSSSGSTSERSRAFLPMSLTGSCGASGGWP